MRKNRVDAEEHGTEQLDLVDYIEKVEDEAPPTKMSEIIKAQQIARYNGYRRDDGVWVSLYSGTPVEVPGK